MSADALIPLLMPLHAAHSEPPSATGAVRVGAASTPMHAQRDDAVPWHMREKLCQVSRLC